MSHEKIARALQLPKGVVSKYVTAARVAGLDWPALAAALFAPTPPGKPRGERVLPDVLSIHRGAYCTQREHTPAAHQAHREWTPQHLLSLARRYGNARAGSRRRTGRPAAHLHRAQRPQPDPGLTRAPQKRP